MGDGTLKKMELDKLCHLTMLGWGQKQKYVI